MLHVFVVQSLYWQQDSEGLCEKEALGQVSFLAAVVNWLTELS